jgi:uncharacterized cupin superfamily protein
MPDAQYRSAHLRDIPLYHDPSGQELGYEFHAVRRHLGVRSFGVNAMRAEAGAPIVAPHTETEWGQRQEELYYVAHGHATFTIDGQEVDAPEGTFVLVPDPGSTRGAVARAPDTVVLGLGGEPGKAFEPAPWEGAWSGA